MSPVDEILSQIPMQQLAGQLGVDTSTAEAAARSALPALLGGIQANTADPGGASSFAAAVQQHSGGLVDGGVNLDEVDVAEGQKIVGHVFGDQQGQVVQQLGGLPSLGQGGKDLMAQLLPILAPIVMAWLAKQLTGANAPAAAPAAPAAPAGLGGVLGGVLGQVLGGGGGASAGGLGAALGPELGSILGGLLGGGTKR